MCIRDRDNSVASRWMTYLDLGRDWRFSEDFEARVAALTPEQVDAAFRKYINPDQLSLVIAADSKKEAGK